MCCSNFLAAVLKYFQFFTHPEHHPVEEGGDSEEPAASQAAGPDQHRAADLQEDEGREDDGVQPGRLIPRLPVSEERNGGLRVTSGRTV